MLTVSDAHREIDDKLGDTPRAAHSRFVGYAMRRIAAHLQMDAVVCELVGLCHDLDFEHTRTTPHQHGPLAAAWLSDRLPPEALLAIAAHDHRAGLTCDLPICAALKLADALAVIAEGLTGPSLPDPDDLVGRFESRPWLVPLLLNTAGHLSVPYPLLSDILAQSGYVKRA